MRSVVMGEVAIQLKRTCSYEIRNLQRHVRCRGDCNGRTRGRQRLDLRLCDRAPGRGSDARSLHATDRRVWTGLGGRTGRRRRRADRRTRQRQVAARTFYFVSELFSVDVTFPWSVDASILTIPPGTSFDTHTFAVTSFP